MYQESIVKTTFPASAASFLKIASLNSELMLEAIDNPFIVTTEPKMCFSGSLKLNVPVGSGF